MKRCRAKFTPECCRLIAKLPPEIKKLVRSAIDDLRTDPYRGSELSGELSGYRSLKAKRYRIIYRIDSEEPLLEIFHVGHRREVYETLRRLFESLVRNE